MSVSSGTLCGCTGTTSGHPGNRRHLGPTRHWNKRSTECNTCTLWRKWRSSIELELDWIHLSLTSKLMEDKMYRKKLVTYLILAHRHLTCLPPVQLVGLKSSWRLTWDLNVSVQSLLPGLAPYSPIVHKIKNIYST